MNVYVYQAALLCEDCGQKARETLTTLGKAPVDPNDESTYDSDDFPKGPYLDGGGESDSPQHCDHCGQFLRNPLTSDGEAYVRERLADRPMSHVILDWNDYYGFVNVAEEA